MPPIARSTWFATALLALTALIICGTGLHFIWDGSYQFTRTLLDQSPFFHETRFHSWLLWWPTVWLSHFTDHIPTLGFIYGLPFALAPAAGLLLSWWIVRQRAPWLILWPALGITAGTLPGQVFIINDSILQQHLFWPVFLGLLLPLTRAQACVLAALAVFQLSHPIGAPLLAGAAVAAATIGWLEPTRQRSLFLRAGLSALLAAVCVWKILAFPDPYVRTELAPAAVFARLIGGLAGFPISGLAPLWLAALFLAWHRPTGRVPLACLAVTAILWIVWASLPSWWQQGINYRRWIVPACAPFYFLTAWEIWKPPLRTTHRASSIALAALLFATVLTLQSLAWSRLTARLRHSPDPSTLTHTPLDHWSTPGYFILLQSRAALEAAGTPAPAPTE